MRKLLKDPKLALDELMAFKQKLNDLHSQFLFTELHHAETDLDTKIQDGLYQAEKACNNLIEKLIEVNQSKQLTHA